MPLAGMEMGAGVVKLWWWVEIGRLASMVVIIISGNALPNKEMSVCEGIGVESERTTKNGKGK